LNAGVERRIGRALRSIRAGDRRLAWNDPRVATVPASIRLSSPAFADGGAMPERCAGEGVGPNISPALEWSGLPAGAVDLVLIVQDPDAPTPRPIVHLIAEIPPDVSNIAEGVLTPAHGGAISFGAGSFGRIGYAGPRPVRGHGPHRYLFQIFALNRRVAFDPAPKLDTVMVQIAGSVLARGLLTGTFERR
jgi:Raf kinase inhibitor-like YbhB/YbcL family protein